MDGGKTRVRTDRQRFIGFVRLLGIDPESKIVGRRFPHESHHSQG